MNAQEYRHQNEISIWPDGAPGSNEKNWPWKSYKQEWKVDSVTKTEMVINVTEPSIQIFLPPKEKNTGAAVIICPGGGYSIEVIGKEGYDIAKKLNDLGIAGIVLKYRHYDKFAALEDAHRAIRYTRSMANEWNIDASKVGIGGFSAGGHLALHSAVNLNFQSKDRKTDDLDKLSNSPDFLMLIYPASNSYGGLEIKQKIVPAFIAVASNDIYLPASIDLFSRLLKISSPVELHVYQNGGHGFGPGTPECACSNWFELFYNWLKVNNFIQ